MNDDEKKSLGSVENEGEGSKSADRNYRRDVSKFLKENNPEERAREAARDVEKDKASYQQAEDEGKRRMAEEDPELRR